VQTAAFFITYEMGMIRFRLGLTPNSNVWVGAWWIGFLLAASLCAILALPLLAFPPALPGKLVFSLLFEWYIRNFRIITNLRFNWIYKAYFNAEILVYFLHLSFFCSGPYEYWFLYKVTQCICKHNWLPCSRKLEATPNFL
jgi:hypothetical protein